MTEARSQIAQLVEDDKVHAGQMLGEPTLPTIAGLGLEPVDEVDDVVEASLRRRGCNFSRWRWPEVLPVPVPPASRTSRCWAMKPKVVRRG
jgi:hypothetical protein